VSPPSPLPANHPLQLPHFSEKMEESQTSASSPPKIPIFGGPRSVPVARPGGGSLQLLLTINHPLLTKAHPLPAHASADPQTRPPMSYDPYPAPAPAGRGSSLPGARTR
jgi:hypothetical protein